MKGRIIEVDSKAHKADINGTCATHQCWYRIPCSVFLWQSDIWPPSCTCLRASQSLALADTARVDEFMACERQVYTYTSWWWSAPQNIQHPSSLVFCCQIPLATLPEFFRLYLTLTFFVGFARPLAPPNLRLLDIYSVNIC